MARTSSIRLPSVDKVDDACLLLFEAGLSAHLADCRAKINLLNVVAAVDWAQLNLLYIVAVRFFLKLKLRLARNIRPVEAFYGWILLHYDEKLIIDFNWLELMLGSNTAYPEAWLLDRSSYTLSIMNSIKHLKSGCLKSFIDLCLIPKGLLLCNEAGTIMCHFSCTDISRDTINCWVLLHIEKLVMWLVRVLRDDSYRT